MDWTCSLIRERVAISCTSWAKTLYNWLCYIFCLFLSKQQIVFVPIAKCISSNPCQRYIALSGAKISYNRPCNVFFLNLLISYLLWQLKRYKCNYIKEISTISPKMQNCKMYFFKSLPAIYCAQWSKDIIQSALQRLFPEPLNQLFTLTAEKI